MPPWGMWTPNGATRSVGPGEANARLGHSLRAGETSVLEAESLQAALLATAGEIQAVMNHQGLAARSVHTAKVLFESDLRAELRRALQFGRAELVGVDTALGADGLLAGATDVVVQARTKVPQLAVEIGLHPRGEDHAGFAAAAMGDVVKMGVARSRDAVEQATVLVGAPARFWRWLPGFAEDRMGFELLNADPDTPASARSDFLAGPTWDPLFEGGLDGQVPERLWASLLGTAEVRSPWLEMELRLIEVKGLGPARSVRD